MKTKEVTILTGFLGAGKTTLLNAILSGKPGTRFAIVENEIGEESIDAELIITGDDNVVELNNGCLCCSLNDNLYDILNTLWNRKSSWDHMIIEATGIADPANIARPFLTNDQIQRCFLLKRVICVVDAELIEDQLKETEVAIKQIAFSDIVLLNKTEKVSEIYLEELQQILKNINPFAAILLIKELDFKIDTLLKRTRMAGFYSNPKTAITAKGIFNLSPVNEQGNFVFGPENAHHQHLHSEIETILLRYEHAFDMEALQQRMMVFLMLQAANVYRIKGILFSKDYTERVIFQSVGKGISITYGDAWKTNEQRASKIVIIGKRLKLYSFDKMFRSCFLK